MQRGSIRRPRRRVVLASGVVLALAACSGAGDAGGTDTVTVTVGHLTVTVPPGWTEGEASGPWDKKFVGDGYELQIAGTFSDDPTASAAFPRLDLPATLELPGYEDEGVYEPDVEIEGADSSMRRDFTYTDGGEAMEGTWVIAGQWPYPSTAAIALTGASLEPEVVDPVIDTLEFTKTQTSGEES